MTDNLIISLSYVLTSILSIVFYEFWFRKKEAPQKKLNHQGWISIEDEEIPDKINGIILTDGKKVTSRSYDVDYNKHGQAIMGYPPQTVTHWMPFPQPPKIEKFR